MFRKHYFVLGVVVKYNNGHDDITLGLGLYEARAVIITLENAFCIRTGQNSLEYTGNHALYFYEGLRFRPVDLH